MISSSTRRTLQWTPCGVLCQERPTKLVPQDAFAPKVCEDAEADKTYKQVTGLLAHARVIL